MSAMLRTGTKLAEEPKRRTAAWCVKVAGGPRYATGNGCSSASHAETISRQMARMASAPSGPRLSATSRSRICGLALGNEVRKVLLPLELADLEGGLSALVQEVEDLFVEVIDPGSPIVQAHSGS